MIASYKYCAPDGAEDRCHLISPAFDDNPPKLMYKGKAEQISNSLIAYA